MQTVVIGLAGLLSMIPGIAQKAEPKAELVVQTGHSGYITFLKISPDGKLIASGDQYSLILWDVETGRQIRTLKEFEPDSYKGIDYTSISFDDSWQFLFDGTSLVEVSTGRRTGPFDTTLKDLGTSVLSADGKTLALTDRTSTYLETWSTTTGRRLRSLKGESITLSQDGRSFAVVGPVDQDKTKYNQKPPQRRNSPDNSLRVYSLATGKEISRLPNAEKPLKIAFCAGGTRLVSVDSKGLRVWDIATGKRIQNLSADFTTIHVAAIHDYDSPVRFYFSPDGNSLVAARDDEIKFWDLRSGKITRLPVDGIEMSNLGSGGYAFTADGGMFAAFRPSRDAVVAELWDVRTRRRVRSFECKGYRNIAKVAAAFLPDDRTLAVSRANEIDLWDATAPTAQKLSVFRPIVHTVANVSLGADGQTLAVGSDDELVDSTGVAGKDITAMMHDIRSDAFDDAVLFWRLDGSADPVRYDGALLYSNPFDWNPPDQGIFYHADHLITCEKNEGQVLCTIRETSTGEIKKTLTDYQALFGGSGDSIAGDGDVSLAVLSSDLNRIALSTRLDTLELWDITDPSGFEKQAPIKTGRITMWELVPKQPVWKISVEGEINSIIFGAEGATVQVTYFDKVRKVFRMIVDAVNGKVLEKVEIMAGTGDGSTPHTGLSIDAVNNGTSVSLIDTKKQKKIAELYWLNRADWAVVTPDGRFDTSLDLEGMQGLQWIMSDDPLRPLPLDVFMRQYYEPGLLRRVLKCNEFNNCDKEFKPLPSIGQINRVQPLVSKPSLRKSAAR